MTTNEETKEPISFSQDYSQLWKKEIFLKLILENLIKESLHGNYESLKKLIMFCDWIEIRYSFKKKREDVVQDEYINNISEWMEEAMIGNYESYKKVITIFRCLLPEENEENNLNDNSETYNELAELLD